MTIMRKQHTIKVEFDRPVTAKQARERMRAIMNAEAAFTHLSKASWDEGRKPRIGSARVAREAS